MGFRVWGFGFRVLGLVTKRSVLAKITIASVTTGLGVRASVFRVRGLGIRL